MIEPPKPNYDILFAVKLSPIKRYFNRNRFGCSPESLKIDVDLDPNDFGKIDWLKSEPNNGSRTETESSHYRRQWY